MKRHLESLLGRTPPVPKGSRQDFLNALEECLVPSTPIGGLHLLSLIDFDDDLEGLSAAERARVVTGPADDSARSSRLPHQAV